MTDAAPPYQLYWEGLGLDRPGSGIYYYANHLGQELKNLGITPSILTDGKVGEDFRQFPQLQLTPLPLLQKLGTTKTIAPLRSLKRLQQIKTQGPCIMHGLSNVNLPVRDFGRKNIFKVLTIHDLIPLLAAGSVSHWSTLQVQWLLPRVVKVADAIICVSEWARQTLVHRHPEVAPRCTVVPNGFMPLNKKILTRPDSQIINVLSIARLEKYKRMDQIVKILRSYPDRLRITVVTDAAGKKWLFSVGKDLIRSGKLNIQTHLPRVELFNLYQNHDLYLHTSEFEGFCLPAAEAQSFGLPVVFCSGSGIDEVVGGKTGVGVPRNSSSDDWITAIEEGWRLSRAPEFIGDLQKHISSMSSWKDSANRLKSIYDKITTGT